MPAVILVNSFRITDVPAEIDCLRKDDCTGPCVQSFVSVLQHQDDGPVVFKAEAE